jgi:hypothetical protein
MKKLSTTPRPRTQTRGSLYLFPTLDEQKFPLRKLDNEVLPDSTEKLMEAVNRLVTAGDWTEVKRSKGKPIPIFAIPAAHVERELHGLNDPELTQALFNGTLSVARFKRTRPAARSRRKRKLAPARRL